MEYEPRQFFSEEEHDEVKGFTILQAKNGKYHIAEKWLKPEDEGESQWMDYWIPEADLLRRVEQDKCEPTGTLNDDQFEGVCKMVGWRYDTESTPAQTA